MRRWSLLPAAFMVAASLAFAPAPALAGDCDPMAPICGQIGDAKNQAQPIQAPLDDVKKNLANAQAAVARINLDGAPSDALLAVMQNGNADILDLHLVTI